MYQNEEQREAESILRTLKRLEVAIENEDDSDIKKETVAFNHQYTDSYLSRPESLKSLFNLINNLKF